MTEDHIKGALKDFISKNYIQPSQHLDESASLIKSGIVDSFGILEIFNFIEQKFGVSISDTALQDGLEDSLQGLTTYIYEQSHS